MKHTILARDLVGTADIVWDDVAGTVDGAHSEVPLLRERIGNGPTEQGYPWGTAELRDPAHNPADFLAVLRGTVSWPYHLELPEALADVAPTTPTPPLGMDDPLVQY